MIRKAQKKDIKRIEELGNNYKSNFAQTYLLEQYIDDSNYIILVSEDIVVNAFLLISITSSSYELEFLYVDKDYRKRGIATELINYFLENYKDTRPIYLEVASCNKIAINLYKKFAFEIINIRKHYYDNNIDAYVMKR